MVHQGRVHRGTGAAHLLGDAGQTPPGVLVLRAQPVRIREARIARGRLTRRAERDAMTHQRVADGPAAAPSQVRDAGLRGPLTDVARQQPLPVGQTWRGRRPGPGRRVRAIP